MNPTSPPPRPLSEADQLDCYLEKRDTWLETQDRGTQKDIRPDAPWLEFLDVRYRLLVAYQRHERGRRETKKSPTAVTRVELRTAFLQLSGALDQVTVPVEYWSERPHEKLQGEQNHASMLSNLNALIHVLESLAAAEKDCDSQRVVVERMMREQTKILEEQRRFASPSMSRESSPPASTSIHFRPEPVTQS